MTLKKIIIISFMLYITKVIMIATMWEIKKDITLIYSTLSYKFLYWLQSSNIYYNIYIYIIFSIIIICQLISRGQDLGSHLQIN